MPEHGKTSTLGFTSQASPPRSGVNDLPRASSPPRAPQFVEELGGWDPQPQPNLLARGEDRLMEPRTISLIEFVVVEHFAVGEDEHLDLGRVQRGRRRTRSRG